MHDRNRLRPLAILLALGLSACSGAGGGTAPSGPAAPQQPSQPGTDTAAQTYTLVSAASSYAFPALSDFSGAVAMPAANVPDGTTLQLTSALQSPAGGPTAQDVHTFAQSAGTLDVYFYETIRLSATVTFQSLPGFTLTLPKKIDPAGQQFYYAVSTTTPQNGAVLSFGTQGPGAVAGQTVTFAPTNTPLTLLAGKVYIVTFYSISAASATPSATPTVTPTVTPTATPAIKPTATPTATPTVAPTVAPTATPAAIIVYTGLPGWTVLQPGASVAIPAVIASPTPYWASSRTPPYPTVYISDEADGGTASMPPGTYTYSWHFAANSTGNTLQAIGTLRVYADNCLLAVGLNGTFSTLNTEAACDSNPNAGFSGSPLPVTLSSLFNSSNVLPSNVLEFDVYNAEGIYSPTGLSVTPP